MAYDIDNPYNWVSDIIRYETNETKEIYKSPINVKNDNEYSPKLIEMFDVFMKDYNAANISSDYIDVLKEYKEKLVDIIDSYVSGNIKEALRGTDYLIEDLKKTDESNIAFSSIHKSISFTPVDKVLNGEILDVPIEFYRARKASGIIKYSREEMLHIPFDKREKVSSARFSIPGMPCLYLGSSSYCCWIEMGCPSDDTFNVSPVYLNEDNVILNLSVNSWDFENAVKLYSDTSVPNNNLITVFKLWLLSLATSFTVSQENRNFKSEYILSQLFMLAAKDVGCEGISYLSKRVTDDRLANIVAVNLALFEDYGGESKLSGKCEGIKIAPSMNFAMYKKLSCSATYNTNMTQLHMRSVGITPYIGDFQRNNAYEDTEFYRFDQYLFSTHMKKEIESVDIKKYNANS